MKGKMISSKPAIESKIMKNKLTETIVRLSAFVLSLSFMLAAGANAQNSPPVAIDDFYGVDQLAALNEAAPGVLVNDSDPTSATR